MALVLEANYSKKLGLPGYSSHQYALTIRTELSDVNQVAAESARLYSLLQSCVDQQIQETGYLPENNSNGHAPRAGNGHGHNGHTVSADKWNCSDKQRELIQKIVSENNLDKHQLEELSQERFGKAVKSLNKLEASGFIEELFRQVNPTGNGNGNGHRNGNTRFQKAGAR